jgi:hypothetical protein
LRQKNQRLGTDALLFAPIGLYGLDAARANFRPLLVPGTQDRRHGAAFPIIGGIESLNRLANAVLDPLGVLARVALGMVADQNRLTEGDAVGDPSRLCGGPLGLESPLVAVDVETVGAIFGAVDQAGVVVVSDLAGQFDAQVGTRGRRHRRDELVLFRRPRETGGFEAVVDLAVRRL